MIYSSFKVILGAGPSKETDIADECHKNKKADGGTSENLDFIHDLSLLLAIRLYLPLNSGCLFSKNTVIKWTPKFDISAIM